MGDLLVAANGVSFRGSYAWLLEALEVPVRLVKISGFDDDNKGLRPRVVELTDCFEHLRKGQGTEFEGAGFDVEASKS